MNDVVRAAGGIAFRRDAGGALEVLLVHRPLYDDWTFPKGKAKESERDEDCALREVEEETGLTCALGQELATTSYVDARARPKVVRYWAMRPLRGTFNPHDEIDEIRWLEPDEARHLLTYDRDLVVLESLYAALDS